MAEDDLIIYYFDGEAGCDQCNLLTGYSFDDDWESHPACDCPIETIDMETEGNCYFELRDPEWDETYDEAVDTTSRDCFCSWSDKDVSFSLDTLENNNLSSELEEVAREEGWSPPDESTISLSYTIPKLTKAIEKEFVRYLYYANVEAAWYLVCDIDGNVSAQEVDMEYGDYFSMHDYSVEITDTENCIGP